MAVPGVDVDAGSVPVDSGQEEVTRIMTMLQSNPNMLNQFKNMLNIQPEKSKNKLLLDDYTFRRIEKYSGAVGTWHEWSFGLTMTAGTVDGQLSAALEEIKKFANAPLNEGLFDPSVTTIKWGPWHPEIGKAYTQALFGVLIALTSGEANAVVRNSTSKTKDQAKCGFSAFYALCVRFNPKTPVRTLQFFTQIVNPTAIKNVREIPTIIEAWESKVSTLSSEHEETLSDKLKTAILVSMLPNELQDIVFQNMDVKTKYETVRDKVISLAGHRIQMAAPTPMDIGAVNNGSNRCEHHHEQAWTQDVNNWNGESELEIGQVKGYGKGNMQCYNCQGYGHLARDCQQPRQPKGYGKGQQADVKGKGKGETRMCYSCGQKGHLASNCKGKGKGQQWGWQGKGSWPGKGGWQGKGVNEVDYGYEKAEEVAEVNIGGVWMIAEVGKKKKVSKPTNSVSYPPGLKPSLIKNQYQSLTEDEEDEWIVRESKEVQHKFATVRKNQKKSVKFATSEICEVRKRVKIGIDSCAAETVCPQGWASEFKMEAVKPGETLNLVNASGGKIGHYGERKVALQTEDEFGWEKVIGLPFQVCDVKRPLAAVSQIVKKGNIVQFGEKEEDCFIMNVSTQERIWLSLENGQYVMEACLASESPF